MMGIKRDTKAFANPNNDKLTKSEGVNTLSPQDMAKLGGEDVGNVLNKVADPNWIDPSKKVRAVGSDKMDKDAFMKLMLAQMKNQDPTNPLKSHEMAAQLAQFSQLEQLQNVNTTLEQMKASQKPTETYQSLNFIGKSVAGDSARLHRAKGDKDHDFTFTLPDDAKDVVIKVRNELGDVVRSVKLQNMKKGENLWTWNGKTDQDMTAPVGDYQFLIEATNSNDKKLAVKTDFDGVITGVNYTPEGPVLLVGNQSVKLKDVRKIVDPRLNQKGQNSQIQATPDLKSQSGASETEDKGAEEIPIGAQASVVDQAGLSREMMNRLAKEVKPETTKPEASKQQTVASANPSPGNTQVKGELGR
jgi:flagellar basal-body rod modification protein FlgD